MSLSLREPQTRDLHADGRRRLPATATLVLLASIVVSFLASSSAPTPLYAHYQAEWGFSPITTTVVFGVYALAVLAALLTLGKISDHLGRRPVLLAALLVQAGAMVVFATADGVTALLVARVVQGVATGAALGAVGAGMLDIDRVRGTVANAVVPGVGTATGALVSALAVQFLPRPTQAIYLLLIVVFALQAAGVLLSAETVSPRPGAVRSMIPQLALPPALRAPMLAAAPVLVAVWALAGFYGSLGPALVRTLSGSGSVVLGGLSLSVLTGVAALAVLVLRDVAAERSMLLGIGALVVGVAATLAAVSAGSTTGFFAGTAIAGAGFGSGFQGAVRLVIPKARPHERSAVLSVVYVLSYLAMGGPAVVAGVLVSDAGGLLDTAREYGVAVIVLALLALAGLLLPRREPAVVPARACPCS